MSKRIRNKRWEPVLDEHDIADGITYDRFGRMNYHPEFHPNRGKPYTIEEDIYISRFYDYDGARMIALALGRTDKSVMQQASILQRTGQMRKYRELDLEEWERILEEAN